MSMDKRLASSLVVLVFPLVLLACGPRSGPKIPPQVVPEAVAQVAWGRGAVVVVSGQEGRAAELLGAEIVDPFTWRLLSPAGEKVALSVLSVPTLALVGDLDPEVGDKRIYVRARCTKVVTRPSVGGCEKAQAGWSIIELKGYTQCERQRPPRSAWRPTRRPGS
jgi:hypothetical protein